MDTAVGGFDDSTFDDAACSRDPKPVAPVAPVASRFSSGLVKCRSTPEDRLVWTGRIRGSRGSEDVRIDPLSRGGID